MRSMEELIKLMETDNVNPDSIDDEIKRLEDEIAQFVSKGGEVNVEATC